MFASIHDICTRVDAVTNNSVITLLELMIFLTNQTTTGDDVRDFAKQMKNKLTRKYRHKPLKKSYLDHPLTERRDDEE